MKKKQALPEGWIWTTLDAMGIVVSGGTPSTNEPLFWSNEIPWITPADLSGNREKYVSKGRRNISKMGLDNSSAALLPPGSLLFSSRAPIGYIAIAQNELATNQGFKNLIPVKSTYIDYLYYYLQSAKQDILKMASGTTFMELSAKSFRSIPIPLPPLNEQKRIVSKLEELLSSLEKSKEQLKNALTQINTYKEVILKQAFDGRLTEKWRREIISDTSHITSSDKKNANIKVRSFKKLQEVAIVIMGQSPPGSTYNSDGIGMPLINGPVEFGPTPFPKLFFQSGPLLQLNYAEKVI